MKKRALITGITGFAGRYLARHLHDKGYGVYGVSNTHAKQEVEGAEAVYQANLNDFSALADIVVQVTPTHVFHLAAVSFVGHENIGEIYDTNIVGTRNLLKALSAAPQRPDSVVLTSSANVYGNSIKEILTEQDDVKPANDYAVSKIAMEYMSRQFFSVLNIVIARPFNYTGRGQSDAFLVPKIVNHYRRRAEILELGNLDIARDFSDVRAVVAYLQRLAQSPSVPGEVYNICSGRACTLRSILEICESVSGHRLEVRINPDFVRSNEVKTLVGSVGKLHRAVGSVPGADMEGLLRWMLSAPLSA